MSKSASLAPGTRTAIVGLVITLIGLVALLVVPLVARNKAEAIHNRIDNDLEPARIQIDEALAVAHTARSYAYTYYVSLDHSSPNHQKQPLEYYDGLLGQWNGYTKSNSNIAIAAPEALAGWQKGKQILSQWLNTKGRYYIQYGAPPPNGSIQKDNSLFEKGINAMHIAQQEVSDQHNRLRGRIQQIGHLEILMLAPMVALCFALAGLSLYNLHTLKQSWARERETAAQLELAVKETNHRIKNNLQVIGALIDVQILEPGDVVPRRVLEDIMHQVKAVAAVHDFLSHELRSNTVQSDQMLERLVHLVAKTSKIEVMLESDPLQLEVKQATALALIANELLSNAGKHGARHAQVRMHKNGVGAVLQIADDGPGFPPGFDPDQNANLGLSLVCTLARHDLSGQIDFTTEHGAQVAIRFPLTSLN